MSTTPSTPGRTPGCVEPRVSSHPTSVAILRVDDHVEVSALAPHPDGTDPSAPPLGAGARADDARRDLIALVEQATRVSRRALFLREPGDGTRGRSYGALARLLAYIRWLPVGDPRLVALGFVLAGRSLAAASPAALRRLREYGLDQPVPDPDQFLNLLVDVVANSAVVMRLGRGASDP